MINEFTMHNYDDIEPIGTPQRTGDGIRMAADVGADTHVLGTIMMFGGKVRGMPFSSHLDVCAAKQAILWVNEHGRRFANEAITTNFSFTGNAMGLQKKIFSLVDGAAVKHVTEVGCYYGRGAYVRTGEKLTKFFEEWDRETAKKNPDIFKAASLRELAGMIGVDYATLQNTVDVYNGYCDAKLDAAYGKPERYLIPIREGPFYAFRLTNAYFCTVGGLKMNTDVQVINKEGQPIKGLYASGCDAGGLYGTSYDVGIAAGSQVGWAVNSGRIAAKHAVENFLKA
jgi:fumarate reductase flavoprotein subunit